MSDIKNQKIESLMLIIGQKILVLEDKIFHLKKALPNYFVIDKMEYHIDKLKKYYSMIKRENDPLFP